MTLYIYEETPKILKEQIWKTKELFWTHFLHFWGSNNFILKLTSISFFFIKQWNNVKLQKKLMNSPRKKSVTDR